MPVTNRARCLVPSRTPCLVWEKTKCVANRTPCYHKMQNPMPVTNRTPCLVCDIQRCKTYYNAPYYRRQKVGLFVCALCAMTRLDTAHHFL